ncbi:MAG: glycerophosphodiester phosphodiesterase, partial [Gemmatimonadetes bacterium]|nr:glycerophosphodiester phosphodiesterase [Gemmatimonadota bacterium]
MKVEVIAHRGYSAIAPENTLAAFEEALAWSVDGLEFDVHVSADGVPVVIHDDTLERTTDGRGPVEGKSLAELKRLDAGSWFSPEFREERIPTLEETLETALGRVPWIYPEIKGVRADADLEVITSMIRERGFGRACVMISLTWDLLRGIRRVDPDLAIGYVVERTARFEPALEDAHAQGNAIIACDYHILLQEPRLVDRARELGVELGVWTVDDVDAAQRLIALGVLRLTTNDVAPLLQHLGHKHA